MVRVSVWGYRWVIKNSVSVNVGKWRFGVRVRIMLGLGSVTRGKRRETDVQGGAQMSYIRAHQPLISPNGLKSPPTRASDPPRTPHAP